MAAVFFTSGCNFRCGFCHNASLMAAVKEGYTWERLGDWGQANAGRIRHPSSAVGITRPAAARGRRRELG